MTGYLLPWNLARSCRLSATLLLVAPVVLVALALPRVVLAQSPVSAVPVYIGPDGSLAKISERILAETGTDRSGEDFDSFARRIRAAFAQSPVPEKAKRSLRAGEARLEEAAAAFLPRVSTSLGLGRTDYAGSASPAGQGDRNINASQLVYDFGLSHAGQRAASQRLQALAQSAVIEESKLALGMVQAVLEWQRSAQAVLLAQAFVDTRNQFAEFTAARTRAGVSSPFDLQRAQAKVLEAQDELPVAQRRLQAAATRYTELLGRASTPESLPARFQLPRRYIEAGLPPALAPGDAPVANQLSAYLEMQATSAALEQELRAEQARLWGGFNFEASLGVSDPGSSFERRRTSATVVYRSEVISGFAQRARIRQASARFEESRFELERLERELLARIETARQDWILAERIQATRRQLVVESRRAEESTRELFLFGRATLTEVFRAQEDFMVATQKLLQASFDRQQAWYQWLFQRDQILDLFALRSQ